MPVNPPIALVILTLFAPCTACARSASTQADDQSVQAHRKEAERAKQNLLALQGARTVKEAAQIWMVETQNFAACPTPAQLVKGHELSATDANDPWGRTYAVTCSDDQVTVRSLGPDGVASTTDDVVDGDAK
ncbi:MAG TPA: hypothetical protein VHM70_19165 [Polyangiaceae bacterium]|jgi:hypothetical protein|nr:hypothetical protein [Polyangiaceae bacterium]